MRFKAVICSVLKREIEHLLPKVAHEVDIVWMEQGLHATPHVLRARMQEAINGTDGTAYDAFLVGYGLCGRGIERLWAKDIPVVIPRAHDCITLLLGSKERYAEYFRTHRGVYWYSAGWIGLGGRPSKATKEKTFKSYEMQYGKEHAPFLMEKLQGWYRNYQWAAYIDWGLEGSEEDRCFTKRCADELSWNFDVVRGDPSLLFDLLNGNWDDRRFLTVPPGGETRATHDTDIIALTSDSSCHVIQPQRSRGAGGQRGLPCSLAPLLPCGGAEELGGRDRTGMGLGVDAGGTFTDAVLYDFGADRTLERAKAPTTHHDLTMGIRRAVEQLSPRRLREVKLVSLSTTLATNAIVEGKGHGTGLILIGYDAYDDARIPVTPKRLVPGRFDMDGEEIEALDEERLREVVRELLDEGVASIGLSSFLSVRNPIHEFRAREIVRKMTDLPVICGHELAGELNAIQRAITTGLNGRLIPIIGALIRSVRSVIAELGIHAPLMVVKGDGSLMTEEMAHLRPIDTILSGPAASIGGAAHLTGIQDATVIDIGGTTSDVAVLRGGVPRIREKGTSVGDWSTSVAAVDIYTFGLGGDSYIQVNREKRIVVGPRRVIPLAVLAHEVNEVVPRLKRILSEDEVFFGLSQPTDFFLLLRNPDGTLLSDREQRIVEALEPGPLARRDLSRQVGCVHESLLGTHRLEDLGIVHRASLTPTDLMHVEKRFCAWNRDAADLGLEIYTRQLELSREQFIAAVKDEIRRKLAVDLLHVHRSHQDRGLSEEIVWETMAEEHRPYTVEVRFEEPLIGIGAPASEMLKDAAALLGAELIVPEYADVANAVGAITGSVLIQAEILIRSGGEGRIMLHSPVEQREFEDLTEAKAYGEQQVVEIVTERARAAGASGFEVRVTQTDQRGTLAAGYGDSIFLECRIQGVAVGKPRLGGM